MQSVQLGLWDETAVRDEIGGEQRHATLAGELDKAGVDVLVRESLHQLVMAHRVRRDVDRLGDSGG